MNFTWLDWLMVAIPVLIAVIITAYSRRYVRGVSDFLAGRRCAGRYLVSTAQSETGSGPIGVVAAWQLMFVAGLAIRWWQMLLVITPLILALVGFVIYRYRQTRAMTMGQFYEIRYGKSFRIYAGILTVLSGVVNFGIFPAVGSQFFVNFCGFPQTLLMSGLTIPPYALLMVLLISLALLFTLVGGKLTIMATDCVEGLISWVFYLIIIFSLLSMFSWMQISTALSSMPAGKSLLDPFDIGQIKDFNIWFVVIQVLLCIYAYMSWQGGSGFNCSASSPHEAKMGAILGYWRRVAKDMTIVLLGICAFTYMNHPDFASGAAEVSRSLQAVGSVPVQNQMQAPMALAHFLPTGIKGMFCCIMLLGLLAGDGAYMHSWGSIFIQDVVVPFRKKPFTPKQHLRLLRCSIAGVGIFGFFFSLFFLQTEYIYMFFAMTGAIVAGAGSVILGGLYWKKGTHAAAWCSMTTGSALAVAGFVLKQVHLTYPFKGDVMLYVVNLNGQVMALIAAVSAVLTYVLVSLLTCKEDFDMDRMLYR